MNKTALFFILIVKNISTIKCAELTGLSQSYISELCHGKRKPRLNTLEKLSAINVTVSQYLEMEEFIKEINEKQLPEQQAYQYILLNTLKILYPLEVEEIKSNHR